MKRKDYWFKIGALMLLCVGLYAFQELKNAPVTLTLQDALAKKMVSCKYSSTGMYSGESVNISITNLSNSELNITIPRGSVFKPSEVADQDLIVVQQQAIALNAKANLKQVVDGFCMEATDHAPTANNGMKLSKTTNAKLTELTAFLDGKKYDKSSIQSAVWAVSNNYSFSSIDGDSPRGKALRTFLSKLTQREDPWYQTKQNYAVTPSRVIQISPVEVNGRIQFESEAGMKIHCVVKDGSGDVKNVMQELEYPSKGKSTYHFKLIVKGWSNGNYKVEVMNGTTVLQTFPFTV